jgi:hypothetical protein
LLTEPTLLRYSYDHCSHSRWYLLRHTVHMVRFYYLADVSTIPRLLIEIKFDHAAGCFLS